MHHDAGYEWAEYSKIRKKARNHYDKIFLQKLKKLPKDPRKWENPPIDIETAEKMRKVTMLYFELKIFYYKKEKEYGEVFMAIAYPTLYLLYHEE